MHARSFFRRHKDDAKYVPWHIDADAAATAAIAPDCFNVWLPLAEVGETAPSLEFVLGSHRWMRGVPLFGPDVTERYRSEEWITAHATGQHWIPVLKPGDAVLFDQYTLHRTQRTEFPIQSRDACEFRFMPVPWSWLHRAGPILGHQARRVVRHFMPRKQRAQ